MSLSRPLGPARHRAPVSAAAALLALGAAAISAAPAADWKFEPVVSASASTVNNVQIARGGDEVSDTVVSSSVRLGLTGTTPRSSFAISYSPRLNLFADFGDLDNLSHALGMTYSQQASPRVSWNARARGSIYESPELSAEVIADELVAVPRARVTNLSGGVGGSFQVGRRSALTADAGYSGTSYDAQLLTGVDADGDGTLDITPLPVADASTLSLSLGWSQTLSENHSLSVGYAGSSIDEGFRGDSKVHRLLVGWSGSRGDQVSYGLSVGAGRRSADSAVALSGADETSAVGSARLGLQVGRYGSLSFGASRDFRSTNGTSGTAVSTSLHGAYAQKLNRWSDIGIFARWSQRDPVSIDPLLAKTDTIAYGASWAAALSRQWAVVVSGEQVDQDSDLTGDPRSADYRTLSAGIRWAPRAAER